jgi:hypothetical protein
MWLGPQSVEETERVDSAGTLEGHPTQELLVHWVGMSEGRRS